MERSSNVSGCLFHMHMSACAHTCIHAHMRMHMYAHAHACIRLHTSRLTACKHVHVQLRGPKGPRIGSHCIKKILGHFQTLHSLHYSTVVQKCRANINKVKSERERERERERGRERGRGRERKGEHCKGVTPDGLPKTQACMPGCWLPDRHLCASATPVVIWEREALDGHGQAQRCVQSSASCRELAAL